MNIHLFDGEYVQMWNQWMITHLDFDPNIDQWIRAQAKNQSEIVKSMLEHLLSDESFSAKCSPDICVRDAARRIFTALKKQDEIEWDLLWEQVKDVSTGTCPEGGITRLWQLTFLIKY